MANLRVKVLVEAYKPILASGIEEKKHTMLEFYLSEDLGNQLQRVRPYFDQPLVEFSIARPSAATIGAPFIEAQAGLTIRAWAASVNEAGERNMVGAGSAFVPINTLLHREHPCVKLEIPLVVSNATDYEAGTVPCKGDLTLVIQRTSFAEGVYPVAAPTRFSYVPENREYVQSTLINYLQRAGLVYQELKPTYPEAKGLRLPVWSFGHCQVPGVAFAAPRAPDSPESWWSQTARIALRRYRPPGEKLEQSIAWFLSAAPTDTEVMSIVALQHCAVVSHSSCYVSDGVYVTDATVRPIARTAMTETTAVGRLKAALTQPIAVAQGPVKRRGSTRFVGMEDFALGPLRNARAPEWGCVAAGDCEDGAGELGLLAMELGSRTDFTDPVLLKMQSVRQHYMPCTTLFYVNGQKLGDKDAPLGGHAATLYCTKDYVVDMLERYNGARPVFEGLQRRVGKPARDYYENPVITLEGTGLMWPLGNDAQYNEIAQNINYLEATSSKRFERHRFLMPNSTKQSNFYNTICSVLPLDFADKFNNIEHAAIQMPAKQGHKPTLGVRYLDFVKGRSNIALCPTAPLNEEEILLTKNILKHRYPLMPYPAPVSDVSVTRPNAHLDQIAAFCRKQQRRQQVPSGQLQRQCFYLRYNQINEKMARDYCAEIAEKSRIVNFTYDEECIGNEGEGGYCVTFHLTPSSAQMHV